MKKNQKKVPWKKIFHLAKDFYVNSDSKIKVWLFLIGITLCVIALVALMAGFAWWSAAFWGVMTAKALTPFLYAMGQFALLIGAYVGVQVLKNYLVGKLAILWRVWLTKKIFSKLFYGDNDYLDIKRFSSEIDNIPQRIQEDIKSFVNLTLSLAFDLLKVVLTLGTFVGTLWVVGGPLAFVLLGLNIVIPGYLVWVALIVAVVATVLTHVIAKSLAETNTKGEAAEAELRQTLEILNTEAETIAQDDAGKYYEKKLENKIQEISDNSTQKLKIQSKLVAFQNFYMQISSILPTLVAAPLYFTGHIELAQLMQIGFSFGQVSSSLSWFVESYESLATYKTNIERVVEMQQAFEAGGLASNPKSIVRKEKNKESIKIKQTDIMHPQQSSTGLIMHNLNIELEPGVNLLIKGASGTGKSTLFKVIEGIWEFGKGKLRVPKGKRLCFLPQIPSLPKGTLASILAYPKPVETYTQEQYISVLEAVGGMLEFIPKLEEDRVWGKELSGGQQQRISIARALLIKPDWLFLDEATASLDSASEHHLYTLLRAELKNTTMISIAHRDLSRYHDKTVYFKSNEEKEIEVEEIVRPVHRRFSI